MDEKIQVERRRIDKVIEDLQTCQRSVNDRLQILDDRSLVMQARQNEMFEKQEKIKEILEAWDNAKGFANVVKGLSATTKIIAPIVFFFGIIGAVTVAGWAWFAHQVGIK